MVNNLRTYRDTRVVWRSSVRKGQMRYSNHSRDSPRVDMQRSQPPHINELIYGHLVESRKCAIDLFQNREPSWPWSYGSWIYNYICNLCLSPLMLWVRILLMARCTASCDKVCQWLATGRLFSLDTPVSSTNKTNRHDITEMSLQVALNTIKQTKIISKQALLESILHIQLYKNCQLYLYWSENPGIRILNGIV